jgi:hypothetical protein
MPKRSFLLLLLLPLQVLAENDWWTASFFLDNDLFANADDGYTNGIRFSFVSPDVDNFQDDPRIPQWLRSINRQVRFFRAREGDLKRNMVVTFGQQMYTPDEKYRARTDLIEADRPYAGWLYLGLGYQVSNRKRLESAIVNVGMIGPASYARESQNAIHDWRGFKRYEGWDNQLNNELGLQAIYTRRNKWFSALRERGWGTDVITHWGASLGNVATYVDVGAEWRFGWNIADDFGSSSAVPGGDNSSPGSVVDNRIRDQWFGGFHGFIATSGRWVLHDITLDGNTFSDSHSVNKEPLVGSASVGVAILVSRWKLSFSRILITDQFEGQLDNSGYGSVSLSYTYAF